VGKAFPTPYHPPPTTFLVHRGGDYYAHADGHGADQDCQRYVFVFHDLFPEVVGRHLVDDDEGGRENQDAERGVDDGISQSAGMEFGHGSFTSDVSRISAAVHGAVRTRVIANALGRHALLVDASKAPALHMRVSGTAEQHNAVNQE
jgi:hypothetical protein